MCAFMGHEEAMASIRDVHADDVRKFKDIVIEVRNELGIEWTTTPPPQNPSLPREDWEKLAPADYGEYRSLIMSRKGEHVAEIE
jgi:hypothetical protein